MSQAQLSNIWSDTILLHISPCFNLKSWQSDIQSYKKFKCSVTLNNDIHLETGSCNKKIEISISGIARYNILGKTMNQITVVFTYSYV